MTRPSGLGAQLLAFRAWVAGTGAVLLAGLAILQRFSERGREYRWDPLLLAELVLLALCLAEVWWVHRRGRGFPLAPLLPLLAAVATVLTIGINGPANIIYIAASMMLLFVFLPMRAATYASLTMMVACFVVLLRVWHADAATLIRIPIATGSVLAFLMMTRRMVETLVQTHQGISGLLSDTLDSAEQGIAVIGPGGVIKAYNRRVATMLDVPEEMLDGRQVTVAMAVALQQSRGELSLIAGSSPAAAKAIDFGTDIFHPEFPAKFVRQTMDGRWLEVNTRRMPSGDIVRTYADVTEYQEALRAAESAVQVRTAFLSQVSHEFRTPLNALLGLSHLALRSQLSGRQRQWLEGIEGAGRQLLALVQDLLDLSALESGASEAARLPFTLQELLASLQRSVGARIAARGLVFATDVAKDVPTELHGDLPRMLRVLTPLVVAAAERMAEGRLELRVRTAAGQRVRFTLHPFEPSPGADRPGRPEPERVPGVQSDTTAALGVVLVRRLAEAMGGATGTVADGQRAEADWVEFPMGAEAPGATVPKPGSGTTRPAPVGMTPEREGEVHRERTPTGDGARRSIERILSAVRARRVALATLPYRGWILGNGIVAVGLFAMGFVSLTIFPDALPTQVARRVVIPAFCLGALQLAALWRHRRSDRPDAWDRQVLMIAAVTFFVVAALMNGSRPAVLLSAGILYLYVSTPTAAARWGSLVIALAVLVSAWRFPADILIYTRALIGGLLSWGLAEGLMRALRESSVTFEETATALDTASEELLADQAALVRSQREMAAAIERREELMAVVSHEIRTPMNAILGLAQLTLQTDLTAQQRAWVSGVREHGTYLTALAHRILDMTQIQAGKLRLRSVSFGLDEVLRPVEYLLQTEAAEKGLRTTLDVAADVPPWVRGDPLRLTQILLNLAGNAVRYTSHGGVTVRVRAERVGGTLYLRFEVQDTGDGLSAEQQANLFQPFAQVDSGAMRHGGTGLGLSISKWLVEQMGGEIGVRSEPGVGSTFWCTVQTSESVGPETPLGGASPLAGARHRARALRRSLRRMAGARVLVVDDTRINREIAAELMRGVGIDVVAVENGLDAVAQVRAAPFDLVLLDLQMPAMDGFAVAREIRRDRSPDVLPIVAMTASVLTTDADRCLAAGMNASLEKPFDPEDLWTILLRWIPARQHSPPIEEEPPTGPVDTPPVRSTLHSIRGLSVEQGLRRVLGNEALYRNLLSEFVLGQAPAVARMQAAMQEGQLDAVAQLAHALAGVAGGIGAVEVHHAAAALERHIRQGQSRVELVAGVEAVRRELAPLLADLDAVVANLHGPDDLEASVSPIDTEALLSEFAALLDAHDPEAREWVSQHGGVLEQFGTAAAIREAVRRFDLSGAAASLRHARGG